MLLEASIQFYEDENTTRDIAISLVKYSHIGCVLFDAKVAMRLDLWILHILEKKATKLETFYATCETPTYEKECPSFFQTEIAEESFISLMIFVSFEINRLMQIILVSNRLS